ncbi:MAG: hypothetical protein IKY09_00965 [Methanocorpusculum sp.]|nr:hypothetical protein [Methanocorpusculum sp.]MBR5142207.1 hypothetical protein [Methanocorpusculum sp.]
MNTMIRRLRKQNDKIRDTVVGGYYAIENGVVSGYKKIENTFVSGYQRIEDAFIDNFVAGYGESTADAKKRITEPRDFIRRGA